MSDALVELCVHHLDAVGISTCGFGPDPYDPEPRHHPMAYALYARGLVALHRATGDGEFLVAADALGERLGALSHGTPAGWGLGFEWKGHPAEHPYTITTALCGHAMLELAEAGNRGGAQELVHSACAWLLDAVEWSGDEQVAGPLFAPNFNDVVLNVASQSGGFLVAAAGVAAIPEATKRGIAALRFVQEHQHGLGYWPYRTERRADEAGATTDASVDAVHTSYVLDGLAAAARATGGHGIPGVRDTLSEGLRFALSNLFSDGEQVRKLVVATLATPAERRLIDTSEAAPRYAGSRRWLVPYPGSGPLGGYGGMLGAAGRAARAGVDQLQLVLPILQGLQRTTLSRPDGRFPHSEEDPSFYPRHEAHVFDGLAALAAGGRP